MENNMYGFVVDIIDGSFELDEKLANKIYTNLPDSEKTEIDMSCKIFHKKRNEVIQLLYGTLSQRRRMNPALVKAVEQSKNERFKVIYVSNTDYIKVHLKDGQEKIDVYQDINYNDAEPVSLWIQQKDYSSEVEPQSFSMQEFFNKRSNVVDSVKKYCNKIKRKVKRFVNPDVKSLEKEFNNNHNKGKNR